MGRNSDRFKFGFLYFLVFGVVRMNIYVGNLSFGTTEQDLKDLFGQFGAVESASLIMDKATGKSRGFGFVVMTDAAASQKAIDELNGKESGGRKLTVNLAKEREDKPRGGGYGGGGGGGGRGGFGGGDRGSRY
jgi:RNA recognition motif-containing protein